MILKALTQLLAISMFEYSPTFTQMRSPSYGRLGYFFFNPTLFLWAFSCQV
ncbi:uncharacterized protein METZ01_LOCUS310244 [marine metagenome]|uniref:Uncharacterized protein n=1 Tax=marine metagenome TaxID=408172 RepID=A0A382N9J0_9ZZZZ